MNVNNNGNPNNNNNASNNNGVAVGFSQKVVTETQNLDMKFVHGEAMINILNIFLREGNCDGSEKILINILIENQ